MNAMLLGFHVILHEVAIADGGTFCRFNIDKRNGEGTPLSIMAFAQ